MPAELPQRMREIMAEAAKIRRDTAAYHAALVDWVEHGAASRYALSPDEVVARSRPRDAKRARGHAHFTLASQRLPCAARLAGKRSQSHHCRLWHRRLCRRQRAGPRRSDGPSSTGFTACTGCSELTAPARGP